VSEAEILHSLTPAQFEQLADVPPEEEWLANITNLKTRRAYKEDVREFIGFTGLQDYMRLRSRRPVARLSMSLRQEIICGQTPRRFADASH
jgi:Tfp pilus assembly protein PilN